ncbi:hypothetical protein C0W59_05175 [Photobacterium kishitanii]|nr:hypothetical protein C0W59_05175 [Photobacterium kishitanii]
MGDAVKIILSGVNLTEGGPLKIFQDAIESASKLDAEVICLVNNKELFNEINHKRVFFVEIKYPKKNWIYRVFFEYIHSYFIGIKYKPEIWLSLHDMSTNLPKKIKQFVYCHNSAPFYQISLKDFKYDKKFSLFTLFYLYLYRINIKSNTAVICQQSWLAEEFKNKFKIKNVLVSYPIVENIDNEYNYQLKTKDSGHRKILFYPTLPRTFKNIELIIDAIEKKPELSDFLIIYITIDITQGDYAEYLIERASRFSCFKFTGYLQREKVNKLYELSDIVIFPSKLETWGLPISEAVYFNKPIILSDLPYAHETLGDYDKACFIPPDDNVFLSEILKKIIDGESVFYQTKYIQKYATTKGWDSLFNKLLNFVRT